MKNTIVCSLITAAILLVHISGCCTKKLCLGGPKYVMIIFKGYTINDLSGIQLQSYNKSNGQNTGTYDLTDNTIFLNDSTIRLPFQATREPEGFFTDQNFIIISTKSESDTLDNISLQTSTYSINCNNCPGESDPITNVANVNFRLKGQNYINADTVYILP